MPCPSLLTPKDTERETINSMKSILSSTGTYNFALAKWLGRKTEASVSQSLYNHCTITDGFSFAEEIQNLVIEETGWHSGIL